MPTNFGTNQNFRSEIFGKNFQPQPIRMLYSHESSNSCANFDASQIDYFVFVTDRDNVQIQGLTELGFSRGKTRRLFCPAEDVRQSNESWSYNLTFIHESFYTISFHGFSDSQKFTLQSFSIRTLCHLWFSLGGFRN